MENVFRKKTAGLKVSLERSTNHYSLLTLITYQCHNTETIMKAN